MPRSLPRSASRRRPQIYFDILKETHVGITLDAYHTSARKRTIQAPKFYLFNTGVKRALDNTLLLIEIVPPARRDPGGTHVARMRSR